MWNRLGIKDDNPAKHALRAISQEVYDVVATEFGQKGNSLGHLFRSSAFRDRLTQAFDDRMDRVPTAVKENIPNQSELEIALIKYCQADAPMFKIRWDDQPKNEQGRPIPPPIIVAPPLQSLHQPQSAATKQTKAIAPPGAIGPQIEERYLQRNLTRTETFVYDRAHVVPNAGLQIIRANAPHQPIAVRLSDLLEDKTNPLDVSSDGDWVNASNIKMSTFKKNLVHDELYLEGETIWLSPFSLDSMDLTLMALAFPRDGEKRLVGMNLASVILRMIRENWPMLRKPSPELEGTGGSSPLHRLNMTIIIRGSGALGKLPTSHRIIPEMFVLTTLPRRSHNHTNPSSSPPSWVQARQRGRMR
jgi:hypothetical protein